MPGSSNAIGLPAKNGLLDKILGLLNQTFHPLGTTKSSKKQFKLYGLELIYQMTRNGYQITSYLLLQCFDDRY